MRAFVTSGDGIEALRVVERPTPAPGPHDIVVMMTGVGLNYRDLLVINGVNAWKPNEPRIPVSDGSGVVMAVGQVVTRFAVGDRIAGIFLPKWLDGELSAETYVAPLGGSAADGVMVEYRVFDEQAVVKVPAYLSDVEAATLPVAALTAWHAVRFRSNVQAGETVLIQGTGGVSLFALQFVLALGARPIVISSNEAKLERAKELGAAQTINYTTTPAWEDHVIEMTGGRGVDHVIEIVGGENLNRSLRAVRVSGTISFIGLLAGLSGSIDTYRFVTRNVRIHGIETGSRAMFEDMIRFMEQHELRPIVDHVFEFEEFPQALRHLEKGGHFGKIAVTLARAS
jgi:NADPH:quinone reductase-like Zn-dependent oxidoreductase